MSYEGSSKAAYHRADTDDDDWSVVVVNSGDDDDGSSAAVAGHHLMSDHRSDEDTDDERSKKSSAAVDEGCDLMNCKRSALLIRKKKLEEELKDINKALCKAESSEQPAPKDLKPSRSSLVMDVERPTDEDTALFIRRLKEGASSSKGDGKMVKSDQSRKRKHQLVHDMDDDEEESEFSPQSPSVAMNCDVETDCDDFEVHSAAREEESKAMHKRNDGKTSLPRRSPRCHAVTLITNTSNNTVIDLTGVPPQLPILKCASRIKDNSSKYVGVCFENKKWQTQIWIDGKLRHIGCYEDEEEAAVDYARALLKYRGPGALDKAREKNSSDPVINLSGVPPQTPILKPHYRIKERSSKYAGVYFKTGRNKWFATIHINGKNLHIGYYEDEEEAAVDYARALLKYIGPEALDKARKRSSSGSAAIDLSDVPPQSPIAKSANRASKYAGVYFDKSAKKWIAKICIKGKRSYIGCYNKEEEAASNYARAVFKYRSKMHSTKRGSETY